MKLYTRRKLEIAKLFTLYWKRSRASSFSFFISYRTPALSVRHDVNNCCNPISTFATSIGLCELNRIVSGDSVHVAKIKTE